MAQNISPAGVATHPAPGKDGESQTITCNNQSTTKRLQQELMTLMMAQDKGVSAFPSGDSILSWIGTIQGASGTVYEGLEFKLTLSFPAGYPHTAPIVKFVTPCFHPNVDDSGNICLDILKDKWSAAYDVRAVLLSIQSLLSDPNNDSPLNTRAAGLWKNQEQYKKELLEKYNMAKK